MKIKTKYFFIILFFCASSGIFNATAQMPGMPEMGATGSKISYIDCHNHLHGQLPPVSGIPDSDFEGAAEIALSIMDKSGIKKMIIMPPPFIPQHPNIYDYNYLIPVVKKYPDRFAFLGGGGTLNVMIHSVAHHGEVSSKLHKKFKQQALEILSKGAIGFGEMSAEHFSLGPKHIYASAPPDHPLFLLLADIAAEHNVPIDIHMEAVPEEMPLPQNLRSPPNPKVLYPNIPGFERLLAHNRKAKIIWSHVGWCNTGRRTTSLIADLLKRHPNLYMSFKISPMDSRAECIPIERGVGLKEEWLRVIREFPDRFFIGADHFYVSPRSPIQRIGPPSAEPTNRFFNLLPPELAHKLGHENPKRIFNLK